MIMLWFGVEKPKILVKKNKIDLKRKKIVRFVFLSTGTLSLSLGVIGIFVPLLPTTPFLLLAAACYARGSKKFYDWLINHKVFGSYIRNIREGKGIPKRTKFSAISLLWITILFSVFMVVPYLWLQIFLIIIAIGVTFHIVKI